MVYVYFAIRASGTKVAPDTDIGYLNDEKEIVFLCNGIRIDFLCMQQGR